MKTVTQPKSIIVTFAEARQLKTIADGGRIEIRRKVEPAPRDDTGGFQLCDDGGWMTYDVFAAQFPPVKSLGLNEEFDCPFGVAGNVLKVEEQMFHFIEDSQKPERVLFYYEADFLDPELTARIRRAQPAEKMPDWGCRIRLQLISVRVEFREKWEWVGEFSCFDRTSPLEASAK